MLVLEEQYQMRDMRRQRGVVQWLHRPSHELLNVTAGTARDSRISDSTTMARLSGIQRDVLSLYRKCLRAIRQKPIVCICSVSAEPS